MTGGEGFSPEPSEGKKILSEMVVEDGGRGSLSNEDQRALDDLLVEEAQREAKKSGELVSQSEIDPAAVRDAMAVDSETWVSNEQNK